MHFNWYQSDDVSYVASRVEKYIYIYFIPGDIFQLVSTMCNFVLSSPVPAQFMYLFNHLFVLCVTKDL